MRSLTSAATTAMLLLAVPAWAQPTTPTADTAGNLAPSGTGAPVSMVDGNFLTQAVADDQAQLDTARIAGQRAGSDGVRQFAQLMERDHAQLAQELQVLARNTGIQTPAAVGQQQQAGETRLLASSGQDFDRAYLDWVVGTQQRSVDAYQHEAASSTVPAVKSYAQQALPMLRAHVERARQLRSGQS